MSKSHDVLAELRNGHQLSAREFIIAWAEKNAPAATVGSLFDLVDKVECIVGSIANEAFRVGANAKLYDDKAA